MLSGTPQLSRPAELYTSLDAIAPGRFGSYVQYTTRFCDGHFNEYRESVAPGSRRP